MQGGQSLTTGSTLALLEEEFKRAVASPPAHMTSFVDDWLDRVAALSRAAMGEA